MLYDFLFKIIFIGDSCVGKTSLVNRLTRNTFHPYYESTIGVDFSSLMLDIDGTTIKTHIWDTAGQPCFSPIIKTYYRGVAGAVLVFDVGRESSFKKIDHWFNEMKEKGTQDHIPVTILVGNKTDTKKRVVDKEVAEKYAKENNMLYCETSSKKNVNVREFYKMLIEEIHNTADLKNPDERKGIRKSIMPDKKLKVQNNRECCVCCDIQ